MSKKIILSAIFIMSMLAGNAKNRVGENIDVTHYEIRINNLDFTNHTLDAVTTVTLTALGAVSEIDLELKSLTVTSVTSNDLIVSSFSQDGDILKILLGFEMYAGQTASFTISYNGNTFNDGWGGVLWSGNYVCNMGVGFDSQPHNLGKTWFPCVDDFVDKATYDLYVTVPASMTSSCGGILEGSVDNGDGTKTDRWVTAQEIPTYLISFAVGDYQLWEETYHGIGRDIPVNVYAKPSQFNKVPGTFVNVKEIAAYFESCFGAYPLNRIGYVSTSVGCMEHVDNIGFASSLITGNTDEEMFVAHEMAHAWFGDMVTCKTAGDMWLNEGFAQFAGMNYEAALYGEEQYQAAMTSLIESITKNCHNSEGWIPLNNMPLDLTYGTTVYDKGATVVHTLRNYLGVELFNEAMQYYLNKFAWQSASSEDLRDAITEYTGIDMTGFFDSWVFTCGAPHYSVDSFNVTPYGDRFDVEVFTSQKHRHSGHIGNGVILELAFMDADWNIVTDTIHWDGATGHTTKTIDFEPVAVFCDYYDKYADARSDRNFVIKNTGNIKFNTANFEMDVESVGDSTFMRVEHHWVGPDHSLNAAVEGLRYSDERYISIFRDDRGEAKITGKFVYQKNDTYDGGLIQSENDSTFLLYREDASKPWHSIPYTFQGNWKLGRFTIADVMSGDYTLAAVDLTMWDGTSENAGEMPELNIYPNPAKEFLELSFESEVLRVESGVVSLVNSLGQTVESFPFHGEKMRISVANYPSGSYFVNLIDGKENVVATRKVIIK
ncbi:MAG: T9SS type A sorting domain-containing protein [Bacteroidales bacterium]|nr:T9SS type A sorting domain-containing protein [Bacteroidales bacterium]